MASNLKHAQCPASQHCNALIMCTNFPEAVMQNIAHCIMPLVALPVDSQTLVLFKSTLLLLLLLW